MIRPTQLPEGVETVSNLKTIKHDYMVRNTGWGNNRFTVVYMESNRIINK